MDWLSFLFESLGPNEIASGEQQYLELQIRVADRLGDGASRVRHLRPEPRLIALAHACSLMQKRGDVESQPLAYR